MENKLKSDTQNRMGTMPVGKLLTRLSLPVMISMLTQACYNIVDSIFVARVSENALTAVSLAFPMQILAISVAVGTGVGINSLISRWLGAKRFDEANRAASNGLFIMALSSVIFLLFGLTLVDPFFKAFTDNAEIYSMGTSYLRIVMVLGAGVFMQIGCERIIQSTGNTVYPMLMQLVGALTNIILDPILIFGYLGFPPMGVAGAAVATVVGQFVGMLLSFYIIFKKKHEVVVSFKGFRPDWRIIKEIYLVGLPSIIMQSIGTVLTLALNKILIAFTPTAVSVLGAYFKLNSFVFLPLFALNGASLSIMGYNFGARDRKRVMQTLRLAITRGVAIMAVGTLAFTLLTDKLLLLFDASDEMLNIGIPALRIIALSFTGAAAGIGLSNLFQAVGKGIYSLFTSILRQLAVILPVSYFFAKFFGLDMVWWAFPISELVALISALILFRSVNKRLLLPLDMPLDSGSAEPVVNRADG